MKVGKRAFNPMIFIRLLALFRRENYLKQSRLFFSTIRRSKNPPGPGKSGPNSLNFNGTCHGPHHASC
jgi:hypothetical protein